MTSPTFEQALKHHQEGDVATARQEYQEILQHEPKNADVLHLLAILNGQQSNFEEARDYMKQALMLSPNAASFQNSMGNIEKNLKNFDSAIKYFQNALRLEPNSVSANNNLASVFVHQQNFSDAIKHYRAALKIQPKFIDAHYNLALVLLQQNQEKDALSHLHQCLELDKNYFPAMTRLGQVALHHEKYEEAKNWLQKSVDLFEGDADALANLGAAEVKLGGFKNAETVFNKALKLDPKHYEAHFNLGCLFLTQQNPQAALSHFMSVLSDHASPELYYNIGVIYMYQDHHRDAISYLKQALQLDSQYFDAHMNLGVTFLKMEQYSDAIKHYEAALKISPNNSEVPYILAALKGEQTPDKAPKEYVTHLFDQYAPYYEKHLLEYLEYQSPKLMLEAIKNQMDVNFDDLTIIDLGCGTGLTGQIFKPYSKRLIGIDLSPKMVELADEKNIYDELHVADMHATLTSIRDADLVLAGDVLSYLGDLSATFSAVKNALKKGGLFTFTVESAPDEADDYKLQKTARYWHSKRYIDELAKQTGFEVLESKRITLRKQKNFPVEGYLFILC